MATPRGAHSAVCSVIIRSTLMLCQNHYTLRQGQVVADTPTEVEPLKDRIEELVGKLTLENDAVRQGRSKPNSIA